MMQTILEIIKLVITISVPLLAAFFAYSYGLKSKHKDRDLQKENEINNVLSNLLIVWHYLTRLDSIRRLKFDDTVKLPISKDFLASVIISSGMIDDEIFSQLDNAISNLKRYDPISFYELEGIGKRYGFLKKNYIIPMLRSNPVNKTGEQFSSKYLNESISEIEDHLMVISGRISSDLRNSISLKIDRDIERERKEMKDELLNNMFELLTSLQQFKNMTFEEYIEDIERPETQATINKVFAEISKLDLDTLISIAIENPDMAIDEISNKIQGSTKEIK